MSWRAVSFEAVDLHFLRCMLIPSWFGPERFAVTTVAVRLAAEQFVSAFRGFLIEIDARTWFYRRQRQLVELQCRQLAGDLIAVRISGDVPELRSSCDGKLGRIVEPLVKESAHSVHFVNRD